MKRVGNAGTILMYNLSGPEFSKLRQIFAMLRLRMRVVEPDRYHIALSDLAAGRGEGGEMSEALPEAMLVFCGLNNALLNQVLEVIRMAKLPPIPLKAVITPSNKNWVFGDLLAHLSEEHAAFTAAAKEQA